jgi:hypothetical protein
MPHVNPKATIKKNKKIKNKNKLSHPKSGFRTGLRIGQVAIGLLME